MSKRDGFKLPSFFAHNVLRGLWGERVAIAVKARQNSNSKTKYSSWRDYATKRLKRKHSVLTVECCLCLLCKKRIFGNSFIKKLKSDLKAQNSVWSKINDLGISPTWTCRILNNLFWFCHCVCGLPEENIEHSDQDWFGRYSAVCLTSNCNDRVFVVYSSFISR